MREMCNSSKELSKELRIFRAMAPGLNLRGLGCRKGEKGSSNARNVKF